MHFMQVVTDSATSVYLRTATCPVRFPSHAPHPLRRRFPHRFHRFGGVRLDSADPSVLRPALRRGGAWGRGPGRRLLPDAIPRHPDPPPAVGPLPAPPPAAHPNPVYPP